MLANALVGAAVSGLVVDGANALDVATAYAPDEQSAPGLVAVVPEPAEQPLPPVVVAAERHVAAAASPHTVSASAHAHAHTDTPSAVVVVAAS